jgi:hypothetical protein
LQADDSLLSNTGTESIITPVYQKKSMPTTPISFEGLKSKEILAKVQPDIIEDLFKDTL